MANGIGWGDRPIGPGSGANWNGWLDAHSASFNAGVDDLKAKLEDAFNDLSGDPSSPALLAAYQTALSEYNMYRMLYSDSAV